MDRYDIGRMKQLAGVAAVVGVGDTDYAQDYAAARAREAPPRDPYELAAVALSRALDDAGLRKSDIDGMCCGTGMSRDRLCEVLGLSVQWGEAGSAAGSILAAVSAITSGLCTTVACIYGFAPRSQNVVFGGAQAMTASNPLSYYYYSPWGMSSQGALIGMMFRRHQLEYGTPNEALAEVAVAFRESAQLNPNAIMRHPLSFDDYWESHFVVEPLRLPDYCLVNDGAVAFIIRRADMAGDCVPKPVFIDGVGTSEAGAHSRASQLRPRMTDFFYESMQDAARQVYAVSGLTQEDIDVFAVYDAFTPHVLFLLEGMGFCGRGESGEYVMGGRLGLKGALPTNTSGGMLSESYMQGWNHQVELVRQLRGGLGDRQVPGAQIGQYAHQIGGKSISIIFRSDG